LGEILAGVFGYICLDSLEEGNWRFLLTLMAISCFFGWFSALVVLRETPRFLMLNGQYDKAFEELKYLTVTNNKEKELEHMFTEENKAKMIKWA